MNQHATSRPGRTGNHEAVIATWNWPLPRGDHLASCVPACSLWPIQPVLVFRAFVRRTRYQVALAGKPHRSLTVAQPYLNDPSGALTKKVRIPSQMPRSRNQPREKMMMCHDAERESRWSLEPHMQHNLQRPRLIVEVLVFASSHGRPLLTIRIVAFRHFVSAKCPWTIEIRTPAQAFHSRPYQTGVFI